MKKNKRKRRYNVHRKRKYLLISLLVVFVFLGIGYSFLNVDLNILGTITVKKQYAPTLYNVLRKEVETNGLAKEYTGEHDDSFTETGTEKIYHWYATNDTQGTQIQDKNNVIFANHCWQMIRTTDTGGVKMIYNGEVEDGKCLNTRGNHPGYEWRTTQSMSTTYYYGTSYEYDKTNNNFTLSGNVTTGTIQTGQYTCKQTTDTATCTTLYYVDTLSSGTTYNVLPINTTSHYSQFGTLQFNQQYNSPAYVGYMYNTVYPVTSKSQIYYVQSSNMTINSSHYFSDTIDYGTLTPNQYTLTNPQVVSSLADYNDLVGKYMITGTNTTGTQARYIVGINDTKTKIYYRRLQNGDLTISMMVGDSYIDNGNDTYTIDSATSVTYIDWYEGSYSSYENKYVCDGTSDTCHNLKHIGNNPSASNYYSFGVEDNTYQYSESVSYSNGTYTLTGDIKTFWDIADSINQSYLTTHHYTCLSSSNTCSTVNYINYYYDDPIIYYVQLSGVEDVETALVNMLSANDVNAINSTMKTGVDAWYEKYLTDYSTYLEDTIYCNDRTITSLGAWKPDGGTVTYFLKFKNYNIDGSLSCMGEVNQFSTSNNKAQLTYPVGLMTSSEMSLLNNNKARVTRTYYWLVSPRFFYSDEAIGSGVDYSGSWVNGRENDANGVRPAVSLKSGTEYTSGDGSMANPYVVKMDD